jgi:hypothetical protein
MKPGKRFNRANTIQGHRTDGTFELGHTSWNKGTKGLTSANVTSFKKGSRPKNHKPVGTIETRKRYNRNTPPIVWIKVAEPNKWEMLKRHTWAKWFGPIPEGMLVTHIDGDTTNCRPDNLVLITRAQNATRNHNRKKAAESMRKVWAQKRLNKVQQLTDNLA